MATPGDAPEATGLGDGVDPVTASIAKKLGGDAGPRDERGRFAPSGDSTSDGSPEAEEASTAETEEGTEPETEDATEDGDQTEQEPGEQPKKFTVKVDGQDLEVTLDEALKGYSRESDYTRKTQALAAERATWQAQRETALKSDQEALAGERKQAQEVLTAWTGWIETQLGNKDYWDNLRAENPGEWSAKQYELGQQLQKLNAQQAKYQKEETDKLQAEQNTRRIAEVDEFRKVIPELKDGAKLKETFGRMETHAISDLGFKPEELSGVIDHRVWRALNNSALYEALQAKKPIIEPKLKNVQPAKPGASQQSPNSTRTAKTLEQFRKTGDIKDLAKHLERKLG